MRRPRSPGTTLIELLISMGILLLVLGAVFLLFAIGSRGFRTVEARQGAQNQLAAVRAALQRDLQLSHFYGMGLAENTSFTVGGESRPRHALSAVQLGDWEAPASRDMFGIPNWDRWVVFRVTNEAQGQLVRHLIEPAGGQRGRALLRPADGLAQLAGAVAVHPPRLDAGLRSSDPRQRCPVFCRPP